MPKALDRLLASPSALRALRAICSAPQLPSTCSPTIHCCRPKTPRRPYSSKPKPAKDASHSLNDTNVIRRRANGKGFLFRPASAEHEFNGLPVELKLPEGPALGELAIDSAEEHEKLKSWVQHLQYRERVHGLPGIQQIWTEMDKRGFVLPTTSTPESDFLWGTFLKDATLFEPLLALAELQLQQNGHTYPRLYEKCMQYWLPRQPRRAMRYHHLLLLKLQLKALPLRRVAQYTKLNSKALETFMKIYQTSNERDLYDVMVPTLHEQGKFELARRWHIVCYHRQDLPSSAVAAHPVVQLLRADTPESLGLSTPQLPAMRTEKDIERSLEPYPQGRPRSGLYNEDLVRRLQRRDIEPVRFDDTFCARLFATRTFPPSTVIQGLTMVGVNEIGPQAVRTMALRTEPLTELPTMFKQLREAGITLQGSVFSVALEKFAMENNFRLVQSMIDSDQHVDVFGDQEIQKKLLSHYLKEADWLQAHRTLAILSLVYNDSPTKAWNLLFQARIQQVNRSQIAHILQDLRANRVMLSTKSIAAMKELLPHRRPGHRPRPLANGSFDELRFVTRTYMTILESALGVLPPFTWQDIIRRYGITGRFRELRRLIYWLLCWYAPREGNAKFAMLPKSQYLDAATETLRQAFPHHHRHYYNLPSAVPLIDVRHPIRQLFPPQLQQALIIWGFRAGLAANSPLEQSMLPGNAAKKHFRAGFKQKGFLRSLDWSAGLRLVVQLRDAGVVVEHGTVTKALKMQFVVLFGRGRPNSKQNRMMQDSNTIPYEDYVRTVNRIWGEPLLYLPELHERSLPASTLWHPRLERRKDALIKKVVPPEDESLEEQAP